MQRCVDASVEPRTFIESVFIGKAGGMDYLMPVMNGVETLVQLSNFILTKAFVCLVSANSSAEMSDTEHLFLDKWRIDSYAKRVDMYDTMRTYYVDSFCTDEMLPMWFGSLALRNNSEITQTLKIGQRERRRAVVPGYYSD